MREFGRMARINIEGFWRQELSLLQEQNVLIIPQMDEAINFLLGTVYRRTLLAMLLFGDDDVAKPDLETAAKTAVDWLFHQFTPTPAMSSQI